MSDDSEEEEDVDGLEGAIAKFDRRLTDYLDFRCSSGHCIEMSEDRDNMMFIILKGIMNYTKTLEARIIDLENSKTV